MKIIRSSVLAILAVVMFLGVSCKEKERLVVMETTEGTIVLKLYDQTPLHRDNFLALVEEGAYDSLLFHRVIQDFMIQGGDPDSKYAEPGQLLGEGDRPYTIPSEFRLEDGIFHRRGVLAAAREGEERADDPHGPEPHGRLPVRDFREAGQPQGRRLVRRRFVR